MKALVRFGMGENDIRLEEVPEPSPGPDQVKIEVKAVGVCGTDLGGHPSLKPPVILGHEVAGVIVELGERANKRKIGERVTSETTAYICGRCRFCKSGDYNLCPERRGVATRSDGAFSKYFAIREASIHLLPPHISFPAGSLSEPLACAVHAVIEQAEASSGEVAVVVGPGPLGLLVSQVAKVCGAVVILAGLPKDRERLALARSLGADRTVDVTQENLNDVVKSMTDGYGADLAFECSGAPAGVKAALECLRRRGRYIQGGILHRQILLDFDEVFFGREITMLGSHTQKPSSWALTMKLLEEKKVNLEKLITEELPLSRWKEAFEKVRNKGAVKIILKP